MCGVFDIFSNYFCKRKMHPNAIQSIFIPKLQLYAVIAFYDSYRHSVE